MVTVSGAKNGSLTRRPEPFRRGGWSGVQVVSNVRAKRPTALFYKPITAGRMAASRGVWIVDLAWEARGGFGYAPRSWKSKGCALPNGSCRSPVEAAGSRRV
ncbi:hypothetical protein ACQEVF_36220 [Nonomuraea polychroma]|uniref:hypothetical protein n=1 Tax=Nonomuraea polychroma TaxID=46176 RepID=UPI003D91834A